MALYLGDTEVAPVIEVTVPEKRFNVGINNLMGTVDENGMYVIPTEPFTPDFSGIKSLPSGGFRYKFNSSALTGGIVLEFETIVSGSLDNTFRDCRQLTSASFLRLTTVNGNYAMNGTFYNCPSLASATFPVLSTLSGLSVMNYAFFYCSNLTNVSFLALATISGSNAMYGAFYGCTALTSISFPALKEILPVVTQNQFVNMFNGCTALIEIHFPAAMQARIEQLDGYADKWGATNATIYFDL